MNRRHRDLEQRVDALDAKHIDPDPPELRRLFWQIQAMAPIDNEARRRRAEELAEACAPLPSSWPPAELQIGATSDGTAPS